MQYLKPSDLDGMTPSQATELFAQKLSTQNGDTVLVLEPGEYHLAYGLNLNLLGNLLIVGVGYVALVFHRTTPTKTERAITVSSKLTYRLNLHNLTIRGYETPQPEGITNQVHQHSHGLFIYNSPALGDCTLPTPTVTLSFTTVKDFPGDAIYVANTTVLLHNTDVVAPENGRNGLTLGDNARVTAHLSSFYATYGQAVDIEPKTWNDGYAARGHFNTCVIENKALGKFALGAGGFAHNHKSYLEMNECTVVGKSKFVWLDCDTNKGYFTDEVSIERNTAMLLKDVAITKPLRIAGTGPLGMPHVRIENSRLNGISATGFKTLDVTETNSSGPIYLRATIAEWVLDPASGTAYPTNGHDSTATFKRSVITNPIHKLTLAHAPMISKDNTPESNAMASPNLYVTIDPYIQPSLSHTPTGNYATRDIHVADHTGQQIYPPPTPAPTP